MRGRGERKTVSYSAQTTVGASARYCQREFSVPLTDGSGFVVTWGRLALRNESHTSNLERRQLGRTILSVITAAWRHDNF
ncbi:hypothetical protein SBBP2_1320012 [Burkholderiales bacterium]|nr:hypothetical protein SBBP2_1320012 [Burkholderiales bacterium]